MRTKQLAGALVLLAAVSLTAPGLVAAQERAAAPPAGRAGASTPAAGPATESWFGRAWRQVLDAFGVSANAAGSWTDKDIDGAGTCGSRGCACCHSSLMVPRNVDRSYVHPPGPAGPSEDTNAVYLRAAKAIAKMEPRERDAVRKPIRAAIGAGDETAARRLIEAVLGKPAGGKE